MHNFLWSLLNFLHNSLQSKKDKTQAVLEIQYYKLLKDITRPCFLFILA